MARSDRLGLINTLYLFDPPKLCMAPCLDIGRGQRSTWLPAWTLEGINDRDVCRVSSMLFIYSASCLTVSTSNQGSSPSSRHKCPFQLRLGLMTLLILSMDSKGFFDLTDGNLHSFVPLCSRHLKLFLHLRGAQHLKLNQFVHSS